MGQRVSLEETAKIKRPKKLQIIEENHRNQAIPVIFGGDYWTRTSGLMRVKQQTTVQTLLKLSRLPKKAPKTIENFDFSLLKSRDLDRIRALPSLGAVYSHRNLAFIGPPGTGKTHLSQAFG